VSEVEQFLQKGQVRVNELVEYRVSLQGWPWAYEKARPKTHKLKEKGAYTIYILSH